MSEQGFGTQDLDKSCTQVRLLYIDQQNILGSCLLHPMTSLIHIRDFATSEKPAGVFCVLQGNLQDATLTRV